MYLAASVVPVKRDSNVSLTCPVCCDFVILLEHLHQVLGMLLADVFDPEVVYHESELDGPPLVLPKAGYKFALVVPVFVESSLEELVGKKP